MRGADFLTSGDWLQMSWVWEWASSILKVVRSSVWGWEIRRLSPRKGGATPEPVSSVWEMDIPGRIAYLVTERCSLYLEIPRCKSPLLRDLSSLFDSARSLKPVFVSFFFCSNICFKLSSSVISSLSLFFSISKISLCFLTYSSWAMSSSLLSSLLS